jgi:hypothetical protein
MKDGTMRDVMWRAAWVGLAWFALFMRVAAAQSTGEETRVIATAVNPDPAHLPTLGVWERDKPLWDGGL